MALEEREGAYGSQSPRDSPSLLAVLRRRWLIIAAVTLLAGATAAAFAYANRDTYESSAKLLFRQTLGPELNTLGLLPPTQDADNLAQTNVGLVESRRVAEATAQELRRSGTDVSTDDVADDVRVTAAKDSNIVEVLATADSARGAARLADVYARTAADQVAADERALAERTLASLRRELPKLPDTDSPADPRQALRGNVAQLQAVIATGAGNGQVIQPGYVPTSRAGSLTRPILLGLLFGLVLGIGLALLREQSDRRLRRSEDVADAFAAPVLTTVPRDRALKRQVPFPDLPPSVAEAFRMLYANLRYARREPVRSVVVTSAADGEGKTTVAWNLASAAASAGLSVALVEADLHRPALAERYGLEPEPGLAEALVGKISIPQALQPAADDGYLRHVHVLVAGHPSVEPWALMQSQALGDALEVLREDLDLVIVDTPPVPHVADAIPLLRRVDGIIVTVSLNSTRRPDADRLRDQLNGFAVPILGIVANGGTAAAGYPYTGAMPRPESVNGRRNGGEPSEPHLPHGPVGWEPETLTGPPERRH